MKRYFVLIIIIIFISSCNSELVKTISDVKEESSSLETNDSINSNLGSTSHIEVIKDMSFLQGVTMMDPRGYGELSNPPQYYTSSLGTKCQRYSAKRIANPNDVVLTHVSGIRRIFHLRFA